MYRSALDLRRTHPAFHAKDVAWLTAPPGVLAFTLDSTLACLVNFTPTPIQLDTVDLPGHLLLPSA